MRRLIVLAASLVPLLTFAADDASAQRRFGGGAGFHPGGFQGGGIRAGGIGFGNRGFVRPGFGGGGAGIRPGGFGGGAFRAGGLGFGRPGFVRPGFGGDRVGIRPGGFGYRAGFYRGGAGWGGPNRFYRGAYYGRPGYWRRGSNWGWGAAGLIAGTALGAAAAYPYYDSSYYYGSPYYSEPYYADPVYVAPVSSGIGGYCATPVRTCALINPAEIGVGCSCRVSGGRAYGTVVGP
jgi:hypothetical protein